MNDSTFWAADDAPHELIAVFFRQKKLMNPTVKNGVALIVASNRASIYRVLELRNKPANVAHQGKQG